MKLGLFGGGVLFSYEPSPKRSRYFSGWEVPFCFRYFILKKFLIAAISGMPPENSL